MLCLLLTFIVAGLAHLLKTGRVGYPEAGNNELSVGVNQKQMIRLSC